MKQDLTKILEFLHLAEGEKNTLRHSWTSKGRKESLAEHSWRLSLMAILLAPYLKEKVDLETVLKMITIHDLAKVITGDIPAQIYQADIKIKEAKRLDETKAMKSIISILEDPAGQEMLNLWEKQEKCQTLEAKFVKALNKIEIRIQHNEADLKTWDEIEFPRSLFAADKWCQFDEAIKLFNELVKKESTEKLTHQGVDVQKIKDQAKLLRDKQL